MKKLKLSQLGEDVALISEYTSLVYTAGEIKSKILSFGEPHHEDSWYIAEEKEWIPDARYMIDSYIEREADDMYEDFGQRAADDIMTKDVIGKIQKILDDRMNLITSIKTIADYYGEEQQLDKAKEELFELMFAIDKYKETGKRDGLIDEVADVMNMIAQIVYFADLKGLELVMQYKMQRQRIRVQDELARKNCSTCANTWLTDEEYPCCSCKNHREWKGVK